MTPNPVADAMLERLAIECVNRATAGSRNYHRLLEQADIYRTVARELAEQEGEKIAYTNEAPDICSLARHSDRCEIQHRVQGNRICEPATPTDGRGEDQTPEELGIWAVTNMLRPEDSSRAKGIAERVKSIVRAERERIKTIERTIFYRLNEHLIEMKPDYDDSISGFNEAWDIVSATFKVTDTIIPERPPLTIENIGKVCAKCHHEICRCVQILEAESAALTARLQTAEKERDDYKDARDAYLFIKQTYPQTEKGIGHYIDDLIALATKRLEDLKKYGRHQSWCAPNIRDDYYDEGHDKICTCGLTQAIEGEKMEVTGGGGGEAIGFPKLNVTVTVQDSGSNVASTEAAPGVVERLAEVQRRIGNAMDGIAIIERQEKEIAELRSKCEEAVHVANDTFDGARAASYDKDLKLEAAESQIAELRKALEDIEFARVGGTHTSGAIAVDAFANWARDHAHRALSNTEPKG